MCVEQLDGGVLAAGATAIHTRIRVMCVCVCIYIVVRWRVCVYSNLGTRKVRDVTRDHREENRWVSDRVRLPLSFPISAAADETGPGGKENEFPAPSRPVVTAEPRDRKLKLITITAPYERSRVVSSSSSE